VNVARSTLSVSEWTLGGVGTAEAIEIVSRAGYPAIEFAAIPALDARVARERLDDHGLTVSSVCGMSDAERDCAHESSRRRRLAGEYLRASLEQTHELGADVLVVVPTYRVEADPPDRDGEFGRAAETISGAAKAAGEGGPIIALEALNRYETHLVRTLADAEELRRRIDLSNVQLMADVFHMNIEEDSIAGALSAHAEHIVHLHLADSQRREPGSGHLDFVAALQALADCGYNGAMAMEFLPATESALRKGREKVEALAALTRKGTSGL
jgi:sugar phosphate isomerase/epimerase